MRIHILRGNIPLDRTKRTAVAIKKSRKSSKVVVYTPAQLRALNRNLMKGN